MSRRSFKAAALGVAALLLSACSFPSATALEVRFAGTVPATAVDAQLQAVVQKADQEQADAFAKHDPTLMRDTAASEDYYQQLVKINDDMAANGVASIELVKIEWGDTSVNGNSATLTAYETWRTTYTDGTTEEDRDRNVYTLVNQNGSWLIAADDHPDADMIPGPGGIPPGSTQPGVPPTRPVPAGPGQSRNWSGYNATGGTFTGVTGTWTVPQADPSTGTYGSDASWVGIGGVQSRDLIQAGTDTTVAGNGHVRYQAWVEMLPAGPHPLPVTVKPGDSVTFSITETSPNNWLVSVKNNTSGQTYQVNEQYTSSHSSAEWIEEAPSGGRRILPLDRFGSVTFTNGSAIKDGQTVSIAGAGAKPVTMIDAFGDPIVTPSALTADGAGFTVTQQASPAIAPAVPGQGVFPFVPGEGSGQGIGPSGRTGRPGRSPFGNGWPFGTGNGWDSGHRSGHAFDALS
jgi:predicted SnoaL-like aldol condensation-catalyzing enzyme